MVLTSQVLQLNTKQPALIGLHKLSQSLNHVWPLYTQMLSPLRIKNVWKEHHSAQLYLFVFEIIKSSDVSFQHKQNQRGHMSPLPTNFLYSNNAGIYYILPQILTQKLQLSLHNDSDCELMYFQYLNTILLWYLLHHSLPLNGHLLLHEVQFLPNHCCFPYLKHINRFSHLIGTDNARLHEHTQTCAWVCRHFYTDIFIFGFSWI